MAPSRNTAKELPILPFEDQSAWAAWLADNHATLPGVWLRLAKKATGTPSVSYAEALEVALCYGWIDGQKQAYDDAWWLQKFTPRGPKSIWSNINKQKAQALIDSGQMQPAGLAAIERAKQDGRWDAAYDSQSRIEVPSDLQAELDRNPTAKAFFATLNSTNRYAILFRIQTAKKPETRAKRIQQFIGMLERHELLFP
jgi:uncharacterized protein YdeI (YjbR/CyaY-like superfamily)